MKWMRPRSFGMHFGYSAAAKWWPTTCVLCRRQGQPYIDLCAACEQDLPVNASCCCICAEPLPAACDPRVCDRCLRRPPAFQTSFAPFRYGYPLDHLIHELKFRGELACARVLGQLFAQRVLRDRSGPLPQMIIPVPLAPERYAQRGYNQAMELALPIGRSSGVPVRTDLVMRQRETLAQVTLNRSQRRRNVRRAFAAAAFPARHVAILDDVITTGSTVHELARVLHRRGAMRIEVWAIARAEKK